MHDDRQREHQPHGAAHQVDPEVADRAGPAAGQAADQGDGHADADDRRDEVLHREAGHLREVAHGRLAAVVLPVRVGHEADRGVPRQRYGDRADAGRVERQRALEPLDGEQQHDREEAEREQRQRVDVPALLTLLVDRRTPGRSPARPGGTPGRPRGLTVAVDAGEVGAEQPGAGRDRGDQGQELEPVGGRSSEPLREDEGEHEVGRDQHRDAQSRPRCRRSSDVRAHELGVTPCPRRRGGRRPGRSPCRTAGRSPRRRRRTPP